MRQFKTNPDSVQLLTANCFPPPSHLFPSPFPCPSRLFPSPFCAPFPPPFRPLFALRPYQPPQILLENQRRYFKAVKDFQLECDKNEILTAKVEQFKAQRKQKQQQQAS
jgi:hypothetical protein